MFGKHKFLLRESRRKSWLSSCDLEFSPLNKFILGGNTTLYSFCQTNMYSEEFFEPTERPWSRNTLLKNCWKS